MLLSEEEFRNTMTSLFENVTETAKNFDPESFDNYINANLVEELGVMNISIIYQTNDTKYRHIIFSTEKKNVNYVVVIDLIKQMIIGHFILDLNREYDITKEKFA